MVCGRRAMSYNWFLSELYGCIVTISCVLCKLLLFSIYGKHFEQDRASFKIEKLLAQNT